MTNTQQNPASQLKALIEQFCNATNSNQGIPAITIWAKVLQANETNIWDKLNQLRQLINDIERSIKNSPASFSQTRYLECTSSIKDTLNPIEITQDARNYKNGVFLANGKVMTALDFCADYVATLNNETYIAEETFTALAKEGAELLTLVLSDVENPSLKILLAELIQGFNLSLDSYRIRGIASIEESLDIVLAKFTRQKNTLNSASIKDTSLIQKTLAYFHNWGQVAEDAKKITGAGQLGYEVFKQISP
jgi:hypothetical protein